MILRLDREDSEGERTWGDLYLDGEYFGCTLEDQVRERAGRHVLEWKVPKLTAIPSGMFLVTARNSPHFGPDTPELVNVPGYSDVLIHGGTTVADTEGCILIGSRQDRLRGTLHGAKVAQSFGTGAHRVIVSPVLEALREKLKAAHARREPCFIQIRNAREWYERQKLPMPVAMPRKAP